MALQAINRLISRPLGSSASVRPWFSFFKQQDHCHPFGAASPGWGWHVRHGGGHPFPDRKRRALPKGRGWSKNGARSLDGFESAEADDTFDEDEFPDPSKLMNSVVKVYCKHTEPNFSLPWQRKRQFSSSSSGFMVEQGDERWVLTNAHSVAYYSQIQVKRRDNDRKFIARVLAIGRDCDIALLTVDEHEFWEGVIPLPLGPLPNLQDYVTVVGYPIGGDTISVTSGVVSRIEVTQYAHGSTDLLGIQIDAAINSGNSGGPVFNEGGCCVGIAFQSYADYDIENIGYMIPTPVIKHFLNDYARHATFTGFPSLGFFWQKIESPYIMRLYNMKNSHSGILVRTIHPTSSSHGVLQPGDVLMEFEGTKIACDGTVPFRTGERIMFTYLVAQKFVGEVAELTVLREGMKKRLQVELVRNEQLVPAHLDNESPSYFIIAGFVFTTLNEPYMMSEYGTDYGSESPVKLLNLLYCGVKEEAEQQVVLLSQVLAADTTVGYEDLQNRQILKFNGTKVKNLMHLVEMVMACSDPYMRFDLDFEQVVVVSTEEANKATSQVLKEQSIAHMASPDILAHLKGSKILDGKPS